SFTPTSDGAAEASARQGKANTRHRGVAREDTADFSDESVGNLRADYVLPSKDLVVVSGGVFWPVETDPLHRLVRMSPVASSDHRLVYLDIRVSGQ
ncbi:endonuclease/exonuclease/phosphatase family protein, partial [Singulisphaera rosea]